MNGNLCPHGYDPAINACARCAPPAAPAFDATEWARCATAGMSPPSPRQRSAGIQAAASWLHMTYGVCRDKATPIAAQLVDQVLAAVVTTTPEEAAPMPAQPPTNAA